MMDHDTLHERTEYYLKSLICEAADAALVFDAETPFGELGVNSFLILKILKRLEHDFGTLPKTLLFENFNIRDLARYFVKAHTDVLMRKFPDALPSPPAQQGQACPSEATAVHAVPAQATSARVTTGPTDESRLPAMVASRHLHRYPPLEQRRTEIFNRYKNESSVSRGTAMIAPLLFFGDAQRGYFNCGKGKGILLAYGYTGPAEHFPQLAEQLYRYCDAHGLQFNLFVEDRLPELCGKRFSATPFGVMQRVTDLASFTLEGQKMKRLRYLVSKFANAGACRTEEYVCGSDAKTAEAIAVIIDQWCATRTMVNPLVHVVKAEILAGTLDREHRLFLTYIDDVLQNAILVSPLAAGTGYLMDLEFYGPDMPLGGLEFGIVNIIQTLRDEGCTVFSLGGTYGCKLADSPDADPAIENILEDLRRQNIFNDAGNLQFKNKFRPESKDIFLCRAVDAGKADNILDIILMIADPSVADGDEPVDNASLAPVAAEATAAPALPVSTAATPGTVDIASSARWKALEAAGFNPLNIPAAQVDFDLKTDSWAQLSLAAIDRQMAALFAQIQRPIDVNANLRRVFPFKHFTLAESGRAAEDLFCQAWEKKGRVPQNILFPSTIFHQIDKGFSPVEIPVADVFDLQSDAPFKGNVDLSALRLEIDTCAAEIGYVCIELADNAAGGGAVSLAHLRQVKTLLQTRRIPLVLDATRVLENALMVIERDPEQRDASLWQVAEALLSQADAIVVSLAKDFCVNKGGLIATNDEALHDRLQALQQRGGRALDITERKCIAASLQNRGFIETQVRRRVEAVRALGLRLLERQLPVVRPASAHCVLIDVKRIPAFRELAAPVASFTAWLYLATGIRAGAHSVGMQQKGPLNQLVRLAIPVGLKAADVTRVGDLLVDAFADIVNIPDLAAGQGTGDLNARVTLDRLLSPRPVAQADEARSIAPAQMQAAAAVSGRASEGVQEGGSAKQDIQTGDASMDAPTGVDDIDIAIIGMAARLPKARNAEELWDNLIRGRDCIDEIPQSRYERRRNRDALGRYRGGFIDDVDKFDSLFFNISPREAETLDPQERLFLEVAWETLEDAGYYPEAFQREEMGARRIGVYVGAVWAMYQMVGAEERLAGNKVLANSFLWSVANRASYFLNFTGPSIAVDTACSASLTAIHLACDAIRRGECAAALVGGVNLDVHQCKQEITVAGGLLSKEGLCRAFGRDASGYVPGEGVSALLLKPLSQARRDRDNIYAVVKGSAISHGGRNSGYAVPNSKAQCDVVTDALRKSKVDARSIGYIEAHGTGTELGDPIEIAGLNQAFEKDDVALQSCAIGSIKTNIGHLEAAAGIAGVCKTILQMRHRMLVPSLHSAQLNEFIDFAHSPFVVQQTLAPWHPKAINGVLQPLRAGISSFGAGGSNAHVILEAVESPAEGAATESGPRIFPLSARNEEQLRQVATRLKAFVEKHRDPASAPSLDDIAFTLQLGRKSFDHRVAIVADSHERLIDKLQCFLAGTRDENILNGHVKNAEGITRMLSRKEKEAFVDLLAKSRDPIKLAQLWSDGLVSEWQGMQTGGQGRRISLPTYPFADKRHWLEPAEGSVIGPMKTGHVAGLHPLIDSNESTFERQVFRKVFTDSEFFIYDHLVSNIPTLPGVAYLDLARKAGEIAAGRKVRRIRNILWVSPLTVQDAVPNTVLIELKAAGDFVAFEVFSEREDGRKQLYCQGKLLYATSQDNAVEDEYVDLPAIRERCEKVMDGERAYPLFRNLGLGLGPTFQALTEVRRNPQVGFEVLGALEMPALDGTRFDEFVLHPSLVDSSFQAAMAARLADAGGEMFVPYSLGEVEILHPLTRVCYSYVTEAKDERKSSNVSKMNVLIVDEQGKVLVKVRDSVGVPLLDVHEKPGQEKSGHSAGSRSASPGEAGAVFSTLYFRTDWQPSPLSAPAAVQPRQATVLFVPDEASYDAYRAAVAASGGDPDTLVAVLPGDGFARVDAHRYRIDAGNREDFDTLLSALREQSEATLHVCFAWSALPGTDADGLAVEDATMRALDRGVYAFLYLVQAVIAQKCEASVRLQYLYFSMPPVAQPHNEAIQGFATILRAECPKLACKVVEIVGTAPDGESAVVPGFDQASVAAVAAEFRDDTKTLAVRYCEGVRYLRRIHESPEPTAPTRDAAAIRHRGVYLITGGAGGLGLIFAEYLAKQFQARMVLSGRGALRPETEATLESLRAAGAEVVYVPADVSLREDVERLVRVCKDSYGGLHGIIHSAGVLRDAYLRNKTRDEMAAVFAPKIRGSVLLDDATRNEPLDFFVMFSSLAALAGNAGQSDYSFANHFMDAFAAQRNARARAGERNGKALSLNWSIWAEGGMRLDEQTALFFERNLGIRPLQREVGIQALMLGLHSDLPHLAVLQGVKDKVERAWGIGGNDAPKAAEAVSTTAPAATAGEDGDLSLQVQGALSQIVMDFLKIDADDVDLDTILLDLGFDSIGLTSFSNIVNDKYGLDITPVLFFEYPNIREIAKHLAQDHREAMLRVHAQAGTPSSTVNAGSAGAAPVVSDQPVFASKNLFVVPDAVAPAGTGRFSPGRRFIERPIAIVGMSGVMPQADTLDEYWDKLSKSENNMVTLVPSDRWDWKAYYGNPLAEKNKTLSKWGGFMREVDKFDPLFWGISPREAEMMDPQQRIFLESVWGAIEDSGHRVSDLAGTKTGLFVGAATRDYIDLMATNQAELDGYSASGTSHAILVNRVSFLLNLHGPSAPLDTACSSSLVALHRAIESIHTGSCDMAIVGGVQVMLTPAGHISFGAAGMLADDGKCKTFDSRANGYVRGEGSGAILIKPLENAIADGDHIYAVVKSTAENHGGKVTMLTAPNPNAQADLLVEAYEKAEIDPRSVGYLECHGTGTSLGDPIEIQAMKKAFSELYRKHQLPPAVKPHIGLTSAKTNIGHLETAAGIAGILKVLLSIKHKQIPALLHFEKLNPYISLDNTPFYPVEKTRDWEPAVDEQGRAFPRRAGISSFGFGGANVHVVLEEYIEPPTVSAARPTGPCLIVLSAKTVDRLRANAERLLAHLVARPDADTLADIAYTLQVGRDPMPERMGLVVDSVQDLIERLQRFVRGDTEGSGVRQASVRRKSDIGTIAADVIAQHLRERDLAALLDIWLKGQEPAWTALYAGFTMRRCALPTYAFARERYWFSINPEAQKAQSGTQVALHPLLHRNVSVFGRQSFASDADGLEKALRGVCVRPQAGLPELLPVEMVRLAVQESLGDRGHKAGIELRSLAWAEVEPVTTSGGTVSADLYATGDSSFDFDVRTAGADGESVLCEGAGTYAASDDPDRIDVSRLRTLFRGEVHDAADFYRAFVDAGIARDRLPDGVVACLRGERQLLLEFRLPPEPDGAIDALDTFALLSLAHLASLDHLAGGGVPPTEATLLALERIAFAAVGAREGAIWVRSARGGGRPDGTAVIDIDVVDAEGRVLIKIKGLTIGYPVTQDAERVHEEEFAAVLDSLYAPTPASDHAPQRIASLEFEDALDALYEEGAN
ncbi:SDR family NAD(P)-dependent oxidoreductase [Tahibacter amnicola]|uniref:SDR family NAD(P)-dependent oxidoreductase n=1 Tax=Tahibacter amnicola TaxID=2976241 RepID=A0ABY6B7Y3_9GAMM|nr:SDR family NAD(P)-dependent oxidoreductase [Tahibacter amnicola]UXI66000.1 SDR family NAD(P)-dependent oxidoreductase [Tahibacter amnicola]